jgi:hypothetical protein
MFRTSCIHQQEDHLYMQFCMICYSCIYVSSLAGGCAQYSIRSTSFPLLDCLLACTNGLPNDEQMIFETCRTCQELHYVIVHNARYKNIKDSQRVKSVIQYAPFKSNCSLQNYTAQDLQFSQHC